MERNKKYDRRVELNNKGVTTTTMVDRGRAGPASIILLRDVVVAWARWEPTGFLSDSTLLTSLDISQIFLELKVGESDGKEKLILFLIMRVKN